MQAGERETDTGEWTDEQMMKLAFSTLGCPNWPWREIYAAAKDLQIDGIEIRGIENEMYAPRVRIFDEQNRGVTLAQLSSAGIALTQLTSGATLGMPDSPAAGRREVLDYIDMAATLGVPYIRVMISNQPGPEPVDLDQAKKLYLELCAAAKEKGVCLLIETNGVLADSRAMADFMEGTDPVSAGVLWDIHHPYRFFGESPDQTYRNIGRYVKNTHVKDSVFQDGKLSYRMMGYGDVPIYDALKILNGAGYRGFITLEWTKRWNKELQEPGIVFYHYASYMKYLMEELEKEK